MTDEELIALFGRPDGQDPSKAEAEHAWSCFLAEFEGRIRYTCRFWMNRYGRPDEAEDRVQDVFTLLCKNDYRAIRQFAVGRAKMSTWLTAITTNTCRGWFRTRDRTVFAPERPDAAPREAVDPDAPDPLDAISDDESGRNLIRALANCVGNLDAKRREVFVTRLLCQLAFDRKVTMTEVGRIHGDSPQKTKYRLDTTLEQLRECVRGQLAMNAGGAE